MRGKIRGILKTPLFFLMAAQAVVQMVAFLSLPVFARLFSKEIIGAWGVLMTLSTFFLSFATLKTDLAIVQAKTKDARNKLFFLGLLAFSLIVCVVAVASKGTFWVEHRQAAWLVVLILLGSAFHQLLQLVYIHEKAFIGLSIYRLCYAVVLYPLVLVLQSFFGEQALFYCFLLAVWLVPIVFYLRLPSFFSTLEWSRAKVRALFEKHRKTMGYLTSSSVLDGLNEHFFVLLISSVFGLETAGLYFFALRLCRAPVSLVNSSLSQYNFRRFESQHEAKMFSQQSLISEWLKWVVPAFLFYGGLWAFGEAVVDFLFGAEWKEAGKMVGLLAISAFFAFLSATTAYAFLTLQKQEVSFYLTLSYLVRPLIIVAMAKMHCEFYTILVVLVSLEVFYLVTRNVVLVFLSKKA